MNKIDKAAVGLCILLLLAIGDRAKRNGRRPGVWWNIAILSFFLGLGVFLLLWILIGLPMLRHFGYSRSDAHSIVDWLVPLSMPVGPIVCLLWLWAHGPGSPSPGTLKDNSQAVEPKSTDANKDYYLLQTGQQSGPFTLKELAQMKQRGEIAADAQYRFGTAGSWKPITRLSTLLNA
jgi:hypothetical protein